MNSKIYDEIKRRIIFLEYKPGQTLDEKKIASQFRVSRTPIREVLQRLEWERLVEIIPRGTITITKLELQELKNVYFMRMHIEGIVGQMSVMYATISHLDKMKEISDTMKAVKNEITPAKLVEFDTAFRKVLNEATDNDILAKISDSLYTTTLRMWVLFFSRKNSNDNIRREYDHLIEEINNTIRIIRERNQKKAETFRKELIIRNIKVTNEFFMQDIVSGL